jgi:hypothetical protein
MGCPGGTAPYAVMRDHVRFSIGMSSSASGSTFVLTEYCLSNTDHALVPLICKHGSGAAVPSVLSSGLVSPRFQDGICIGSSVSLHALKVSVHVSGPEGSNLIPSGDISIGTLNQRLDTNTFATWGAIQDMVVSRRGVKTFSAYSLLTGSQSVLSYPMDQISWKSFERHTGGDSPTANIPTDGLAPIVVTFQPGSNGVLVLDIYPEYRIIYGSSGGIAVSELNVKHQPGSEAVWQQVGNAIQSAGGFVYNNREQLMAGATALGNLAGRATRATGPALLALA